MYKLQDIALKVAKSHNLNDEMDAAFVLQKTLQIIENYWGKKGAQNVKPHKIIFNKLYIKVPNSAWAQEVQLRKHEILEQLNQKKIKNILDIKILL